MMRYATNNERHRLPVTLIVVTATLGLMAACSNPGASAPTSQLSTETSPTPATPGTAGNAAAAGIEVDGRQLYLECQGSGSPTVVLQSGFGNAGDIWSLTDTAAPAVFPALAETNRVCVYDRPGSMITTTTAGGTIALADAASGGRSDQVPMPRDPAEVVTELHDLLAAADAQEPFVLVATHWAVLSTCSTPAPTRTRSAPWSSSTHRSRRTVTSSTRRCGRACR